MGFEKYRRIVSSVGTKKQMTIPKSDDLFKIISTVFYSRGGAWQNSTKTPLRDLG